LIRIVDRYLVRETLLTWAAVTAILMLILLSNRFALLLGDAASGLLPRDTVFELLGLASVSYFIVVIPVALFLGVMLALGRLYRDSEMTTLMACGVSPLQIYRPLIAIAAMLAIILAVLSLVVAPWAVRLTTIIKTYGQHNAQVGSFESGRFKVDQNGRGVLYAAGVNRNGHELQNVFIEGPNGERQDVISADSGTRNVSDESGAGTLVLHDGYRYDGIPGHADFRIVKFAENGIRISPSEPNLGPEGYAAMPTHLLLKDPEIAAASEFQWRLSVPMSALLLTLLAVPLARTSPRQGRYGKLFAAILTYAIYSNMVGIARVWLEKQIVPKGIGIWWVPVLLLLATLLMLYQQYGWRGMFFTQPSDKHASD
jgi:lipopolysaccharide export system permease protein